MATTEEEKTALIVTEPEAALDIDRQSIRGRACPQCGGKIIPSNTAVFAGQGESATPFVSWQCERCGYLEVFEVEPAAAGKHGKGPAATKTVSSGIRGGNGAHVETDSNSGAANLPPDVKRLLDIFKNRPGGET